MALQKQQESIESDKKNRLSQREDLLWNIKEEILKALRSGPTCLSELATILNLPSRAILKALKEMKKAGVVAPRKYFQNDPEFQIWGITRPAFFR